MAYKLEFKNIKGKNVCMKFKYKSSAMKEKIELQRHIRRLTGYGTIPIRISKINKNNKC